MNEGKKFLSDLKLYSDYLKWVPEKNRFETWEEACEDVINNTYRKKYPDKRLDTVFDSILDSYKKRLILASQRSLQYRSKQIEAHNGRLYNCCVNYCYSPDAFAKGFYVLLCGEGLGVNLHTKFVSQLPKLKRPVLGTKTFIVEDSIEGWADAANALISSFCDTNPPVPEYQGYGIKFDFSKIRPKGAFISGGFSAPGPDGLIQSLSKIESLLLRETANGTVEFADIVAYDVFMHLSNAVLSGGVRRCLPEGTLVKTTKGSKRIEDIQVGDVISTPKGDKRVVNTFYQGVQSTIKIKHVVGEFECTRNHRMAVFTQKGEWEFKTAGTIEKGDRLVWDSTAWAGEVQKTPMLDLLLTVPASYSRNNGRETTITRYPDSTCEIEGCLNIGTGKTRLGLLCSTHAQRLYRFGDPLLTKGWGKHINLPSTVTEDLAWLVGLVQGDGYVSLMPSNKSELQVAKGVLSIAFHEKDTKSIVRAERIIGEICPDSKVKIRKSKGEKCYKLVVSSKKFAMWLHAFVKQANIPLTVPEFIKKSPPQIRSAYVAGLFDADGCDSMRRSFSLLSSVYDTFLEELIVLCTTLGFCPSLRKVRDAQGVWQPLYSLSIVGYAFKEKAIALLAQYSETFVAENVMAGDLSAIKEDFNSYPNGDTEKGDSFTIPVKVLSLEEGRTVPTYDIEVEDIHQFTANGFVTHNSAMLVMFGKHQTAMVEAKMGNWFVENPQRARSNNSVMLVRGEYTQEEFDALLGSNDGLSDIGFVLVDNIHQVVNPCQPSWATVLTPRGISTIGEIEVGSVIWGGDKWVTVTKKWSTGVKDVNAYTTNAGVFYGTENHKVISGGERVEAKDANSIDISSGPLPRQTALIPSIVMDGIVIGDGSKNTPMGGVEVLLNIGANDGDYFSSEIAPFIGPEKPWRAGLHSVTTSITYDEVPKIHTRTIPERFVTADAATVASFLRGLYSANGSICGNRVTLKSTSLELIRQAQLMLSSLGIRSYITTNKPSTIKWHNGTYESRESYDLNISSDRSTFAWYIGFIQRYKQEKLEALCKSVRNGKAKLSYDVNSVEYVSTEEVFDITVDSDEHTYWTGGVLVSNCAEIMFNFYHEIKDKSEAVFQKCNLNEINAAACVGPDGKFSKEMFILACKDAAALGTFQAGFTSFPYLGKQTEAIVAGEALLGVSITGWMERPELFDADLLREGAEEIVRTNAQIASVIGINPAARTTCVKPSGNASVVLQTTSGIHPEHSPRYFRVMQLNKGSQTAKWLEENYPSMLEESVWSATKADYGVFVPVVSSSSAIFKDSLSGVEHLKLIKLVQENWVKPGKVVERCYDPSGNHNTSCTVLIDSYDEIAEYMKEHSEAFTAVSFLARSGDKDYNQAPFTSVKNSQELLDEYGDGVLFASGLIVDGLHYFDGNLWKACDHVMNRNLPFEGSRDKCLLQKDWVRRAKKFAKNYLKNDLTKAVYCLKDVHLWHKWQTVKREFKTVDFNKILTKPNYTLVSDYAAMACHGGSCEI